MINCNKIIYCIIMDSCTFVELSIIIAQEFQKGKQFLKTMVDASPFVPDLCRGM